MLFKLSIAMFAALQVGFMLDVLTTLPIWADAGIAATVATTLAMVMEYSG